MSSSGALIPPAVGFLFDSECRSSQKKKELISKSNGLLYFLPRRMYENYLLHDGAIAAVANAIENFRSKEVSPVEVKGLLESALSDSRYYCEKVVPENPADKLVAIHGKAVLRTIFSDLSETRVRYNELEHGLALTEWLIQNSPDNLTEVSILLRSFLAPKGS
jgi:hypothetical protein